MNAQKTADALVAAHDTYDRAVSNLRNVVAYPKAEDEIAGKERDKLAEAALASYGLALDNLDELQAQLRQHGPLKAPGAEEPMPHPVPGTSPVDEVPAAA
jgi:hypothetical protein